MGDGPNYEKKGYLKESFRLFHLRDVGVEEMEYHYHEFDKVVVFLGGTASYIIEGRSYFLRPWDVLLVGHHGSKYSSQQEFLSKIEPDAAIISVGDNNYGHPTDAAISRLEAAGATVYRTDRQGCVTVTLHKQ